MRSFLILCFSILLILGTACSDDQSGGKKPRKAKATPTSYDRTSPDTEEKMEAPVEEEMQTVPPEQLKKAKEILAAATAHQISGVDAKGKYKMFCAACHGFDGALGVNGAKDLSASKLAIEESVAQVYFGKGLMTPFKGLLKDHEIVAVSKYIETELRK